MKALRTLNLLLVILATVGVSRAGIRPSFLTDTCAWRATDIVVVTEGEKIDGVFKVIETLKGDLKAGQTLNLPEMSEFQVKESRLVSEPWYADPKNAKSIYLSGDRMILFLIDTMKVASVDHDDDEDAQENNTSAKRNTLRWRTANVMGDELRYSTVWIEKGDVYCFVQVMNPGDPRLVKCDKSEQSFRERVQSVAILGDSFDRAMISEDPQTRADGLEPFVHSAVAPVREAALKQLIRCGQGALPVLRRLLADDLLADFHGQVVEALAKAAGKRAGQDLVSVLTKELAYWKSVAPTLKVGWWNGAGFDSIESVEPFRNRYMKAYYALDALKDIRFRDSLQAVTEFRDYWRSLPQLSELDQLGKFCDQVLHSLNPRQGNGSTPPFEIHFKGNHTFSSDTLERTFRGYVDDYSKLDRAYDGVFEYSTDRLLGFLMKQGYWDVGIQSQTGSNERGTVLSFEINEGKACRLGEITIEGSKLFTASQIRSQLSLNTGDVADGEVIDKWLADLDRVYRNQGYLEYEADDEHEVTPSGNGSSTLNLKITITEGRPFKVGSIKFHGESEFTESKLASALDLQTGDLYSQEKIRTSLGKLEKLGLDVDEEEDVLFSLDHQHLAVKIVIVLDRAASKKGLPTQRLLPHQRTFY